jgi:hypothetical protein
MATLFSKLNSLALFAAVCAKLIVDTNTTNKIKIDFFMIIYFLLLIDSSSIVLVENIVCPVAYF